MTDNLNTANTGRCLLVHFVAVFNLFLAFLSFNFFLSKTHNQEISVANNVLYPSLHNFDTKRSRSVPQVLVLNDCGIDQAGPPEDLKKKCNSVKELDLAQNKLESWSEVS